MTDSPQGRSAGGLLRAARERQGLHIAALAAAIKVTPRKLDALEQDRYDELPDPAFTRALAQAVCRSLKIDAGPVLALLPAAGPISLENVVGTLNTPFRDRPGRDDHGLATAAVRPLIWASGVLMLAALVVMFLPQRWWGSSPTVDAPASAAAAVPAPLAAASAVVAAVGASAAGGAVAPAAQAVAPAASTVVETVFAAPPPLVGASAVTPAAMLSIRVSETSWIEVRDGRGTVLLSRSVQPGESVGLDGAPPLRLTVGNAAGTQLAFRGQPVDLLPSTRDNVARLELN